MIPINKLRIDPSSLGKRLLLTEVSEWNEYINGVKQDTPLGFRYKVACAEHALETITVKIKGKQMMDATDDFPAVRFEGLEIKVYIIGGKPQIVATATGIAQVNKANA